MSARGNSFAMRAADASSSRHTLHLAVQTDAASHVCTHAAQCRSVTAKTCNTSGQLDGTSMREITPIDSARTSCDIVFWDCCDFVHRRRVVQAFANVRKSVREAQRTLDQHCGTRWHGQRSSSVLVAIPTERKLYLTRLQDRTRHTACVSYSWWRGESGCGAERGPDAATALRMVKHHR